MTHYLGRAVSSGLFFVLRAGQNAPLQGGGIVFERNQRASCGIDLCHPGSVDQMRVAFRAGKQAEPVVLMYAAACRGVKDNVKRGHLFSDVVLCGKDNAVAAFRRAFQKLCFQFEIPASRFLARPAEKNLFPRNKDTSVLQRKVRRNISHGPCRSRSPG